MNHYQKYGEYSREAGGADTAKTALIFLGIGIGIGALLSLLLSPTSGTEVRQAVRGKLDDARRGLGRQSARVREQASRIAGQARQKVMPISRTQ
jgi:gas vesicle protein